MTKSRDDGDIWNSNVSLENFINDGMEYLPYSYAVYEIIYLSLSTALGIKNDNLLFRAKIRSGILLDSYGA